MARAKTDRFLRPENRLATFSKAIAHPARIAILKILAERGTCLCGDVVNEMPLAQATVSQHLKALRQAGLIHAEADGPRTRYSLNTDGVESFRRASQFLFVQLQKSPPP